MDDAMVCDFLNEISKQKRPSKDSMRDKPWSGKDSSMDIVKALLDSGMVSSSMMGSFDSFLKNTLRCDMNSIPRTQDQGMLGNVCNNSSVYPYQIASSLASRPPISTAMASSFPPGYCQGLQDPRCLPGGGRVPYVTKTETVYVPTSPPPTQFSPTYPSVQPPPSVYPATSPVRPNMQQAFPPIGTQCYPQSVPRNGYQIPSPANGCPMSLPPNSMGLADPRFMGYPSSQPSARMVNNMMQAGTGFGNCPGRQNGSKGKRKRKKMIAIRCVCLKTKTGLEDCKCSEDREGVK